MLISSISIMYKFSNYCKLLLISLTIVKEKLCIYPFVLVGFIGILISCKKEKIELPTVTTLMATEISDTSAVCGGTIISDGGSEITERGIYDMFNDIYYPDKKPYDSNIFTVPITGLHEDWTYNLFAYATNKAGTALGEEISFITLIKPICGVSNVSENSIVVHGHLGQRPINSNSTPTTAVFEYGLSDSYGEEVTATPSQLTGGFYVYGDTYDATLNGLTSNTLYHYRIKASNSEVTIISDDHTFRTLNTLTVNDIDGNIYSTVTSGTQIWMAENLRVTKFNDGTPIPLVTDNEEWVSISTPAYCWYNNDEAEYKNVFGALYNSYTLTNDNICPAGWHLPTKDEWQALETYLGGEDFAAYKVKDFKWRGSNSSGFSAQMSGERHYFGGLFQYGDSQEGWFWSATEYDANNIWAMQLVWKYPFTWLRSKNKSSGCSIRCIKD